MDLILPSGIPTPVSETDRITLSSLTAAATRMCPFAVNRTEFASRLTKTCSSRELSPSISGTCSGISTWISTLRLTNGDTVSTALWHTSLWYRNGP
eukprot:1454905-Rhodomonas_salina.1